MEKRPLSELCDLIVDCPHSTPKWTSSGVVVLRNQYIKNGRLDLSNPSYTDEFHYQQRIKRATPTNGDIVLTREAPMGELCMIPKGLKCCLGQRMVLIRAKEGVVDKRYLFYAMQSQEVKNQIVWSEGTGSVVSNLRIPLIEALHIPVPPLQTQKEIAHILGTLDDKIELNRSMCKTLEEIAQTLFKHWFIDFEFPNEQGKPYKSSGGEMVDSELGPIPKGWKVGTIGDLCTFKYGKALKTENRVMGNVPVMGSNGQIGWHNKALVKGPGIIVGRKGNPGVVSWSHTDFFPIDTTFYAVPCNKMSQQMALFYVLKSFDLSSLDSDSAVPGLNRHSALHQQIALAPFRYYKAYNDVGSVLFSCMYKKQTESTSAKSVFSRLMSQIFMKHCDYQMNTGRE